MGLGMCRDIDACAHVCMPVHTCGRASACVPRSACTQESGVIIVPTIMWGGKGQLHDEQLALKRMGFLIATYKPS